MKTERYHILLVEDDADFGDLLRQFLELSGYTITWVNNGEIALKHIEKKSYDICVLDVMMPKMDGFTLAKKIVDIQPETPFLFLTARKMKEDKLKGLQLGADDYIVKPFQADELVLRIKNILKRTTFSIRKNKTKELLHIGNYQFDNQRLELIYNSNIQRITEKEAILILYLFQHKNQLLKREDILQSVWKNDDYFSGRSMDVFISRLRKYFKKDSTISIVSIRGVGLEFKVAH